MAQVGSYFASLTIDPMATNALCFRAFEKRFLALSSISAKKCLAKLGQSVVLLFGGLISDELLFHGSGGAFAGSHQNIELQLFGRFPCLEKLQPMRENAIGCCIITG